uniref:Miro domain-containing protein n=1 Tax=Hucho hucho TaxID=62062 RepID=A0A4W5L579_9TELE
MQRTIRLMVLGDEKVGKSSLISALVSQHSSEHVPRVLHDIVIPTEDTRENVVISLHDTSSNSNDVMEVIKTINRSDAAIVVYDVSRPISLECSAKSLVNVKKTFGLAQKAVLYPMGPLYDAEKKVGGRRPIARFDFR